VRVQAEGQEKALRKQKNQGQAKKWKGAPTAYTQAANQTHNPTNNLAISDTQLKRKAGAGLSEDARKEQGLELTPEVEKLVARQVNVLCVYAHVMAVVCAWVPVLLTIFTDCTGTLQSVPFGSNEGPALG